MDVFFSGAWRTPARAEIFIGGSWRTITRAEVYRSSAWRSCLSFSAPMSLSVSPSLVSGTASPAKPVRQTITTDTAIALPSGGTSPYSYVWTTPSGVTATAPNNAFTEFRAIVNAGVELTGTATVVCTDAVGRTASGSVGYYMYNAGGDFA